MIQEHICRDVSELVEESTAWRILVKKGVSIMRLRMKKTVEEYNLIYFEERKLTPEEFTLLKKLIEKEEKRNEKN